MTKRIPRGIPGLFVERLTLDEAALATSKDAWRFRRVSDGTDGKIVRVLAAAEKSPEAGRAAYKTEFGIKHTDKTIDKKNYVALAQAVNEGKPSATIPTEVSLAFSLRNDGMRSVGRRRLRDRTDVMEKARRRKRELMAGENPLMAIPAERQAAAELLVESGITAAELLLESGIKKVDRVVKVMNNKNLW
jgi:hypothetical protein